MRVILLRGTGAAMNPFNAFSFLQGFESLPLRMRAHCENTDRVAYYLARHSKVNLVIYPGLQTGEYRRRADAYLQKGYGVLVAFELKEGLQGGQRFIDALCRCFIMLLTSGMLVAWPSIQPRLPTHSSHLKANLLQVYLFSYVRPSVGI